MKKTFLILTTVIALASCCNQPATDSATQNTDSIAQNTEAITAADTLSPEALLSNMEEAQTYLKDCGVFYIATTDSDQPRVRPFGVAEIIDGRLYIVTGKKKDVYKQMTTNGKFEICALKPSGSEWMRINGTLVADETITIKEEMLNRNPSLQSMYSATDENMAVLYITNATVRYCSFMAPERKTGF